MNRYFKGCILIIISAVLFGCMPLMAKNIYAGGCNAISLVFYRSFMAIPVLYLMVKAKNPKSRILPTKTEFIKVLPLAIFGLVLTPLALYSSYHYISSGAATTIHFIYPAFVLLGCAVFFREKIGLVKGICVLMCTAGVFLFYTPGNDGNLRGVLYALLSGVTYAFYIIYLSKSGMTKLNPFKLSLYNSTIAATLLFLYASCTGSFTYHLTPTAWLLALLFSFGLAVIAVVCFQVGTGIIGPQRASILSTFEPITSIIIGFLVFHEALTLKILVGCILVILSVLFLTIFDRENK